MFTLQERLDWTWFRGLSDGKYKPLNESERYKKSEVSEGLRRIHTGAAGSRTRSKTDHSPKSEIRAMSLDSSLRMSNANIDKIHTAISESFIGAGGLPTPEPLRPLSPRNQIRKFQAENPRSLLSNQSGPMDRFLFQEDHLAEFPDDPEKTREEGKRLRSLRTNALRLRAQLKIKRKELREKQAAKTSSDEAFIRYVRENRAIHPASSGQTLADDFADPYYAAMQIARDEYGPLEDEYTRIEDILDKIEFEMAKIESRLYGPELPHRLDDSLTLSSLPQLDDSNVLGPASGSFLGLSAGILDQYEPIHAEYLSRLGDLDLARERYQNMIQEHESLLLEQESRSQVGMELNANLKAFLANLPAREAELQGEITAIEVDVERLREKCLEAGIDPDEPSDGSESPIHVEIEVNRPDHTPETTSILQESKKA